MAMSSDSPLFDRIRVKPDQDRRLRAQLPACQWPRCDAPATHRAPKGRLRANEYWRFCLDHVREYNNSYNFFAGMSDDAIARYQKEDVTGHRPTWKMGSLGGQRGRAGRGWRGWCGCPATTATVMPATATATGRMTVSRLPHGPRGSRPNWTESSGAEKPVIPPSSRRRRLPGLDVQQVLLGGGHPPVQPGYLGVLAVRVVVAGLGAAHLVAG